MNQLDLIKFIFIAVYKRIQLEEFSRNEEFISVLLTTFRNILQKFPKLEIVKNYFIKNFLLEYIRF